MREFKYKFGKTPIILFVVGMVLSVGCLALNVYRFLKNIEGNNAIEFWDWLTLGFTIVISIGFIIVAVCALVKSKYEVKNHKIILSWGIIRNVIDLSEIKEVRLKTTQQKLELIYNDDSYFIISTRPEWFESFVDAIKEEDNTITFFQETDIEKN